MNEYIIRELNKNEDIPYDLLLLADPLKSAIDDYLNRGFCYICTHENEVIGVYVLIWTRPHNTQ